MATQKRSLRMKMLKSQNETVSKCNETTEVASENEPPNSNGDDKSLHEEKKVNEKANSLKKKVNDEAEKCVIKDEPLDDEFNIKDDNKIPDNPFNGFNKTPIKRVNDKAAEQELQILIKDEPLDDWHQNAESLGKGKRSRIPNKRYSDILSPPTYSRKSSFGFPLGNGSFGKIESGIDTDNSATNEPRLKKQRMSVDLSDKKYKKPFKYGWKRELVWRAVYDESKGRVGDIYYFTPDGKKVRSRNEVLQHLYNRDLTIDNFTFFKAEIGLNDPTKEIVRNAKPITNKSFTNTSLSSPRSPKTSTPKLSIQKIDTPNLAVQKSGSPRITPKLTGSKVSSSRVRNPVVAIAKLTNSTVDTPKSWIPIIMPNKRDLNENKDSPHKNKTPKMKTPVRKDVKKANEKAAEKMEVDPPSTKSSLIGRTRRSSYEDDGNNVVGGATKPFQPCSIRCKGISGIVPTLQCRICLCLYHHECVGISRALTSLPYVCKNCHSKGQEQAPAQLAPLLGTLPTLTPIKILKSTGNQPIGLPTLQRIPRPADSEVILKSNPLPAPPKLTPRPQPKNIKSLVGSLTTWLPHNSKIIDNIQQVLESPSGGTKPQYVEILAGRKFLVIPKHNFMSISPNVAATAVTTTEEAPSSVDSANLGSYPISEVKNEPVSPSKPENLLTSESLEVKAHGGGCVADTEAEQYGSSKLEQSTVQNTREPSPVVAKIIAKVSAANNNTTTKKRTIKLSSITNTEEKERDVKFMDNYVQNLSFGYKTLLHIFQYLKVQDLLRAGCVCTMWRDLTSHPLLWKTIRMKNSQVHSFEGLANSLKKHGTVHLDLRKMLLPNGGDEIWMEFSKAIAKVDTLRRIELCRCPSFVVENLGVSNPLLEVINAVTIKCESMSLEPLKHLTHIHEFRLKSTGGLNLTSNLDAFTEMKSLKYLSLTSIRELDRMNLNVIATLTNLESLDLGECTDFPKGFGEEVLLKLTKLERLRLEKGQGSCHTFEILGAVKQMDHLEQLELVNFDIKAGFDKALGTCLNVKKLLIIPTYISQSATTNHMLLGAVLRLQKTLSHFVWGVTLELLRVTELFIDQCEEPKERRDKKQNANGDCIPVLKPVPLLPDNDTEIAPALEPPQVEILALPSLQKLLMQNLPTTRVKILKIPFHATWRQSITDSSN